MKRPTVLILNGSEDLLAVLGELLQAEGIATVCARIPDIERGREDVSQLVREHDPAVIVFDVSVPFGRSWATFQELSVRPEVAGRPFVLTTTNREGAEQYTGPGVIELLLKPYDIGQFTTAVKEALDRSAPVRQGKALSRVPGNDDPSSHLTS
jgi:DNA-binding NtrC family response regulator